MEPPQLSNSVRAERTARGWSQADLAERSGVSRAEVSALETGRLRAPSVLAALGLARALGLPVEDLFGAPQSQPSWAWEPARGAERFWEAEVAGVVWRIPSEQTLRGVLAHDGVGVAKVAPPRTLIVAGCDPAVGVLAGEVERRAGVRVLALTRSSSAALSLLAQGKVHLAGLHLGQNLRAARRALRAQGGVLMRVATWEAGLALHPSARIRTLGEALRARTRWVSREEGSGAKRALDRLIAAETPGAPPRQDRVAPDHRSVAAIVRSGWAQVGPCLRLPAEEAGLDFLSTGQEAYELCASAATRDDPGVVALFAALRTRSVRALIDDLPGYSTRGTGEAREVPT